MKVGTSGLKRTGALGIAFAFASLLTLGCGDDSGASSGTKKDCGGACPDGQVCNTATNKCEPAGGDVKPCDGKCTEEQTCDEEKNECVNKPSGELTCPDGQKACGETCADLTKDPNHCGDCDTVCSGGQECVDSSCKFVCANDSETVCEDGCHDGVEQVVSLNVEVGGLRRHAQSAHIVLCAQVLVLGIGKLSLQLAHFHPHLAFHVVE